MCRAITTGAPESLNAPHRAIRKINCTTVLLPSQPVMAAPAVRYPWNTIANRAMRAGQKVWLVKIVMSSAPTKTPRILVPSGVTMAQPLGNSRPKPNIINSAMAVHMG